MKYVAALFITGVALTGCATTASEPPVIKGDIPERGASNGAECEADDLQFMVDQKATAENAARAMQQSGAKTLRWIPPNSAVTMDYRQDRLNIAYDDKMVITRINCA